jgi:hypothetical protein
LHEVWYTNQRRERAGRKKQFKCRFLFTETPNNKLGGTERSSNIFERKPAMKDTSVFLRGTFSKACCKTGVFLKSYE